MSPSLPNPNPNSSFSDDDDSVSSPPRSGAFFSAPSSPIHFSLLTSPLPIPFPSSPSSDDFRFRESSPSPTPVASADELFLNGQIRPLLPLPDDLRLRAGSVRRRARSLSPVRNSSMRNSDEDENEVKQDAKEIESENGTAKTVRKWGLFRDLLYRSKSEGSGSRSRSFFSRKGKSKDPDRLETPKGGRKRRVSAHERHYAANRAQAEEMRRRTYLPYRQGLLGCLGFTSKGYGAVNGFARTLNSISSR